MPPTADRGGRRGVARRLCAGGLVAVAWCAAAAADPTAADLLHDADAVKTADHQRFQALLGDLDRREMELDPAQRELLTYLHAWDIAYGGKYEAAIDRLKPLIAQGADPTIRFRAGATAANVMAYSKRFEEAFSELDRMLALLPKVSDGDAREQGLNVAAILYNQVGQYELALTYGGMLARENWSGHGACKGGALMLQARYKLHQLQPGDPEIAAGLDACRRIDEPIYTGAIHTYQARMLLDRRDYAAALALLDDAYEQVKATRYPRLVSEYEALLGIAHEHLGDADQAKSHAQAAIDLGIQDEFTEPKVDALGVLYRVARQQGDTAAALSFHERYAEADRGYVNDTGAARLAYEMAEHQVIANRWQIESLAKQNELLTLQRELDQKAVVNTRLWLALALAVAVFLVYWALRTKRLQLHFQKLAQRDGLTGIANRQYFFEEATRLLAYNTKPSRGAALFILDLDHFKTVNDTHGHPTGDVVLKRVVAECLAQLRTVDLFGRLGGEEFVLLLPECDAVAGAAVAERLRVAIAAISGGGIDFPVSASFGLTDTARSGHTLRQMIIDADHALYRAKAQGRNRVIVYEPPDAVAEFARTG